ncbi:uncharacterized protein [Ranitomeya imitator]|uniref:uncharacterized protein n=1 Tax=Ranitomeya imitator TaxID=111125 RepID=UPI0037E923AE
MLFCSLFQNCIMASDSSNTPPLRSPASSSEEESQEEQREQEQRPRGQAVVAGRRVSQRAHDDQLDIDMMVAAIEERGPLWDSRDPRHADQGILRRLWIEVAQLLWDGFDSASPVAKAKFLKQLKTRWRSMKDRFRRGLKKEGQILPDKTVKSTSESNPLPEMSADVRKALQILILNPSDGESSEAGILSTKVPVSFLNDVVSLLLIVPGNTAVCRLSGTFSVTNVYNMLSWYLTLECFTTLPHGLSTCSD